nr:hypothetical protein Iba_chr13fCG7910 [Ipomoea batatas]
MALHPASTNTSVAVGQGGSACILRFLRVESPVLGIDLSQIIGASGPISIAIAAAPPVGLAGPSAYTCQKILHSGREVNLESEDSDILLLRRHFRSRESNNRTANGSKQRQKMLRTAAARFPLPRCTRRQDVEEGERKRKKLKRMESWKFGEREQKKKSESTQ